ncbi:MAG: HAD-IA family hydrolase [Rhodobacteraceae bacterium]|nr:HAD-IA family hydrolase [Paracoccaceae bacterium]
MARLILFDVDGTLIDSQAHIQAAMAAAFADQGLAAPDRAAVLSIIGLSLPQAMARLAPDANADALSDAYKASFASARASAVDPAPLYPGARDALDRLHGAGHLLGTATGKSRRGLDHMVAHHGLEAHFVTLQCADTHPSKPHPSMVLTAMEDAGVGPEDTVMIGDTTFDIQMGRAAGVATIGVSWGYHPVSSLRDCGAGRIADDFGDLLQGFLVEAAG